MSKYFTYLGLVEPEVQWVLNMAAMVSQMLGFSVSMRPSQDHVLGGNLELRYKT